jgi:CO dehydrogenase nickel-insertion accessory protein CooC1
MKEIQTYENEKGVICYNERIDTLVYKNTENSFIIHNLKENTQKEIKEDNPVHLTKFCPNDKYLASTSIHGYEINLYEIGKDYSAFKTLHSKIFQN